MASAGTEKVAGRTDGGELGAGDQAVLEHLARFQRWTRGGASQSDSEKVRRVKNRFLLWWVVRLEQAVEARLDRREE